MPHTTDNGFDAAVVDKENQALALIEVQVRPVESWANILPTQLAKAKKPVAFILAIDSNHIQLYRPAGENLGEPIVRLDTRQVLQHYDPELFSRQVFESYLLTLVEAWLRDLAYHWKLQDPPGSEEFREAGILEKLEGGTTQRLGA
jgi:hypothetical protein